MSDLREFCARLREDTEMQAALDAHMRKAMGGMQSGIAEMQSKMNAQIRDGFVSYAKEAGYEIPESEMDALLSAFSESLHSTMGRIFQQQFAEALKNTMK